MKILDFISVMIDNKSKDNHNIDSEILFSHQTILDFLDEHSKHINPEEAIKIFIKARRFRLSLQYMQLSETPFQPDFLTIAIDSNAYDIAFYLIKIYEYEI